jgi:ribosomal protein L12E/L44/L45/RPP1/RPP2
MVDTASRTSVRVAGSEMGTPESEDEDEEDEEEEEENGTDDLVFFFFLADPVEVARGVTTRFV